MKLFAIAAAIAAIGMACAAAQEIPKPVKEISVVGPPLCTSGPGLRCTDLTLYPYIYVDGFFAPSDGGGGYFVQGACNSSSDNGGTILQDHAHNCFYRASTNWNVREWGARCDVVVPAATISYSGYPSTTLTTSVPVSLPLNSTGTPTIVIPGLGGEPYSVMGHLMNSNGSNLSSNGSGYAPGDRVTFPLPGASSNIAIAVDSVSGAGAISTWHFLSYGSIMSGPLPSSISGTSVSGTGATLAPAWTGSTYVGTITGISPDGKTITVASSPDIPASRFVNSGWYYGDDDGANINNAIAQLSAAGPGAPQLNLPGNCGTTVQINAATAS
ncbi:MAG TPA: hypothetical protein VGL35_04850, partial [Rhizomicrobium sp.]